MHRTSSGVLGDSPRSEQVVAPLPHWTIPPGSTGVAAEALRRRRSKIRVDAGSCRLPHGRSAYAAIIHPIRRQRILSSDRALRKELCPRRIWSDGRTSPTRCLATDRPPGDAQGCKETLRELYARVSGKGGEPMHPEGMEAGRFLEGGAPLGETLEWAKGKTLVEILELAISME